MGMRFADQRPSRGATKAFRAFAAWLGFLAVCFPLAAVEPEEARQQLIKGDYPAAIQASERALREQSSSEEWALVLADSLLAVGRYTNALAVVSQALPLHSSSVRLRLVAREVFLRTGQPERARQMLSEINTLGGTRMWAYGDAPNLVALGRAALLLGLDPRKALEQFFDRAKKRDPSYREAYLASGQIALDKNDFQLAAKVFAAGLKKFPDDPDMNFGLAQAYAPTDRLQMLSFLEETLRLNTNHVDSYLLLTDHLVDGEKYEAADKNIGQALAVNPWNAQAWAYRAVLRHLAEDSAGEARARKSALKFWSSNPEVDHLIGRKLSQKYRFTEGAAAQRQALQFDASYLPAKIQLAQDLLRLGEEKEGWQLAQAVHTEDAYDVVAYNLVTLQGSLAKYHTLTNQHFILRMSSHEAAVYGWEAQELLERARTNLSAKYGMTLTNPTVVEIFTDQKDFGVRTFGMPGNPGFLGVCFGSVITANSPVSQADHPANWQAVLWHEFCHVITLQLTRNKMPRWLSEGISVYEERQANPAWGQTMNPKYREMVLGKDLTPVGDLSAAFLAPKTDLHLQFAYYESYLVVEFLVERFKLDSLKEILQDLARGVEINRAIAAHTAPLEKIEKDFAAFAKERAAKLAPDLDWKKPSREDTAGEDLDFKSKFSKNYYVLMRQARKLVEQKKWAEAKAPLDLLLKAYPDQIGGESAYLLRAAVHRGLGETNLERAVLSQLAALDSDTTESYLRLMELESAAGHWPPVVLNAERFLAVNPLLPQPYRYLARAQEALGQTQPAIRSLQTMLLLDPPDPADVHFRLAKLLHQSGDPGAKRHLLQSLEEAPRFREAHRLLLEMNRGKSAPAPVAPPGPAAAPAKPGA